jgi:small-conductance mechanosensitive channel
LETLERIQEWLVNYAALVADYFSRAEVLFQFGLIVLLFFPAYFAAKNLRPKLAERAHAVKGTPGFLRFVAGFLRRLKWLLYALLLAVAYLAANIAPWPETTYVLYSAMLLASAWFFIAVLSQLIRTRLIRKTFALVAWALVAAAILDITDEIAAQLRSVELAFLPALDEENPRTLLWLLNSLVALGVVLWLSFALGNLLDNRIQRLDDLTPSLRVLMGKMVRIALVVFGVLFALSIINVDLTALTVLSGAIGVGIGFGLQKVVSNFISGIIILMDRSIKPGDTISLGQTFGWIRELRGRFVSVVTRDGREYLIPNEDFITREVINWSFSDEWVRLDVPFGVSYDSDPHLVSRVAIEAAGHVDRVDGTRNPPVCWMTEFGDSSLNFLLRFWISDPQKGLTNVRGRVLLALWDAFKEHGVKIPFPHREIIFKQPAAVTESGRPLHEALQQPAPARAPQS